MGLFGKSKTESFIELKASDLVQDLAHYCASGAKEVTDALGRHLRPDLSTDAIFLFLFSFRATLEAAGVKHRFGSRAHKLILSAVDNLYRSAFPSAFAETGPFTHSLMRDVAVSIAKSPTPADWARVHAVRSLGTSDPEDEVFHLALVKVLSNGESIVQAVERAA
jgi:hypothetical protein